MIEKSIIWSGPVGIPPLKGTYVHFIVNCCDRSYYFLRAQDQCFSRSEGGQGGADTPFFGLRGGPTQKRDVPSAGGGQPPRMVKKGGFTPRIGLARGGQHPAWWVKMGVNTARRATKMGSKPEFFREKKKKW